jgi:hypothetical protein
MTSSALFRLTGLLMAATLAVPMSVCARLRTGGESRERDQDRGQQAGDHQRRHCPQGGFPAFAAQRRKPEGEGARAVDRGSAQAIRKRCANPRTVVSEAQIDASYARFAANPTTCRSSS